MTIVPDFDQTIARPVRWTNRRRDTVGGSGFYWRAKPIIDVIGALVLLPAVASLAALLCVLNPLCNRGPVFYRQERMGQNRAPFAALKFRTMVVTAHERGPRDLVEADRITALGGLLRRTGLDELPQAINILRGEMSLIGPRPDCLHHAQIYLNEIPDYRHRLHVRPGLSGLAQVKLGYAVGVEATRAKAQVDLEYIAKAGFALDAYVAWRTFVTVITGGGD